MQTKTEEKKVTLFKGDCIAFMRTMKSGSVDAIVTDPPYLYLNRKEQKLERDFDEDAFFYRSKTSTQKERLNPMFWSWREFLSLEQNNGGQGAEV